MTQPAPISVDALSYKYGERLALDQVSFDVQRGEIFGLLGPNGSGKTTLFRLLSTLVPPQQGRASIAGFDVTTSTLKARERMGVVFQAPSLDKKLTAAENLRHQGHLYGMRGETLEKRIGEVLERVGLSDRANELTEKMSGGQRRRVELAKGLLHKPDVLLLDEPSTGLDPGARIDLMAYLKELSKDGVTCLLTTHLMEEAEHCARIVILNLGKRVALDTPDGLKAGIVGDVVHIESREPIRLRDDIRIKFEIEVHENEGKLRIEHENGAKLVAQIAEAFPGRVDAFSVSKPKLEDVFVRITGHKFWAADFNPEDGKKQ